MYNISNKNMRDIVDMLSAYIEGEDEGLRATNKRRRASLLLRKLKAKRPCTNYATTNARL